MQRGIGQARAGGMTRPAITLVTGAAGFIGFHVTRALLARGDTVLGLDNLNDYYDPALKRARLARLAQLDTESRFTFVKADLAEAAVVADLFRTHTFARVIHLAAQAGVRHSLVDPHAYVSANVTGFLNVLEGCRHHGTGHLTYASTSSVYGANTTMPFRESAGADHPLQLYAATKRSNELMAHAYSHLFALPTTGLRFFTVYGPWGRPDMALFVFTRKMLAGEPIPVFSHGEHSRDFTFVDDIVEGVIRASDRPATPDPDFDPAAPEPHISSAPFRIYNIGNASPVKLSAYIEALEAALGVKAERELLPMQPGDVADTFADITALEAATGYRPRTSVADGVARFVAWYRSYYGEGTAAPA